MSLESLLKLRARVEVLENDYKRAQAACLEIKNKMDRGEEPKNVGELAAMMSTALNAIYKSNDLIQAQSELIEVLWKRVQPESP